MSFSLAENEEYSNMTHSGKEYINDKKKKNEDRRNKIFTQILFYKYFFFKIFYLLTNALVIQI